MLVGRFVLAALALAIAGLFVQQTRRPASYGTLPTASWTFGGMLMGVIVVVGGLSYFVALALGPVAEQLTR
jgi:K+-transporting ATPase ATPase A chain